VVSRAMHMERNTDRRQEGSARAAGEDVCGVRQSR